MLSLISVPPRSLAPAARSIWASLGPSLTHEHWMLRTVAPSMSRASACTRTTSAPVAPARTSRTRWRRYIGASWWMSDRGTNSVKPPVSFWTSRRSAMCRTQWAGVST